MDDCRDCVFWLQNRCSGALEACEYKETYDDWDKWEANIGSL